MSSLILALLIILPAHEQRVVDRVASEYALTQEQKALLCAIRRAENGAPHIAFGVEDARCRTFSRQARWAANTIRLRYDGNLEAFAARWCPLDRVNWLRNVRFFINKQKGTKK